MEILSLINIPYWILTISLICLSLYLYTVWRHGIWKRLGIPGPKPYPFLGLLKQLPIDGFAATDFNLIQKYGKVVGVYQGTRPTLLISDPDIVRDLFIKDFSNFTNRPDVIKPDKFTSHSMTVARDDYWKFLRTKISPTFTTGKLRNMTPLIQRCCDDLVDNIKKQSEGDSVIDMKEIASGFTMDVICSTAFGMQVNSQTEKDNQFVSYARRAMRTQVKAIFFLICMTFPFMKSIMTALFETPQFGGTEHFFKKVVSDILKDRNSSNIHRDFIQIVTEDSSTNDNSEDTEAPQGSSKFHSRALTEDEIAVNSLIFFSAGFDTTSIAVSFSSYCLARYPDIQDKLIQEIDKTLGKEIPTHDIVMKMEYLDLFVSEVLRLYAPSTRFFREAREDVSINGWLIPKDADVTVCVYALHRDPEYWPEPETFDPERFTEENKAKRHPYAYLPFGIGPRICVGMRLALLETKMAIVYMLQNFKFVTCDETEIPVIFEKGFLLRAENGIKLKVTQR
ncbi:lithocholate 6-beta-hydroxylase-like [Mytilus trossulus]|uniref:lithocholate 6-beta-hydroxylase-like n=1 Tax=Mytilus trossulus TaxID=6551 RepID=UPI003006F255